MTKQNLSIVQSIIYVLSIFFLYVDGTFIWYSYNLTGSYNNQTPKSFSNIFDAQFSQGFFVILVVVLLAAGVLVSLIEIFKNIDKLDQKYMIALPAMALVTFIVLGIYASNYSDTYTYLYETRFCSVGVGVLFYVEAVLLVTNTIIECLKHYTPMPYNK